MTEMRDQERHDTTPHRDSKSPRTNIHGWGADLNPADRPAVPKEKPSDVQTPRGVVGVRQIPTVKIHKSPEQPDLTPVFGTSCPPKGLSGVIRDTAYKYSEGRMAHWLMLMAADRVDVIEGLLDDLTHLRGPRNFKERGLNRHTIPEASMKHKTAMVMAGVTLAVVAAAVLWPRVSNRWR